MTAASAQDLAKLLFAVGEHDQACKLFEEVLRFARRKDDRLLLHMTITSYSACLIQMGRAQDAYNLRAELQRIGAAQAAH